MTTNQSIFRQKALEHYQHIQLPKTLPKFTSPFTIFCEWMLFFIFIAAVLGLWLLTVPEYEQGIGKIRNLAASDLQTYQLATDGQSKRVIAIMLFPEQAIETLHTGSSLQVQISGISQSVIGQVERVDVQALTTDEIRYMTQTTDSPLSHAQIAAVAYISFKETAVSGGMDAVHATASYQIGTIQVLPLLLKTISVP